jgi:hypothetical protein
VSDAREFIAMRNHLQAHLTPDEVRAINWQALQNVTVNAIARGWTGVELALWATGDLGPNTDNIPASIHTTIKTLGDLDPPRDTTPAPTHITAIKAQRRQAQTAADGVNHTAQAQRVRQAAANAQPDWQTDQ